MFKMDEWTSLSRGQSLLFLLPIIGSNRCKLGVRTQRIHSLPTHLRSTTTTKNGKQSWEMEDSWLFFTFNYNSFLGLLRVKEGRVDSRQVPEEINIVIEASASIPTSHVLRWRFYTVMILGIEVVALKWTSFISLITLPPFSPIDHKSFWTQRSTISQKTFQNRIFCSGKRFADVPRCSRVCVLMLLGVHTLHSWESSGSYRTKFAKCLVGGWG